MMELSKEHENRDRLIEVPPGKYMLVDKNEFFRLKELKTGLLVENADAGSTYKVVLVENKLILL